MRAILKIFGRLARLRVQQACVQMVVSVLLGTHHTRREFASEAANSFPNSTLAIGLGMGSINPRAERAPNSWALIFGLLLGLHLYG